MRFTIFFTILILLSGSITQAEKPGPNWPSKPISVSPVEGVIECFWNSGLKASTRWKCEQGSLTANWDGCVFKMQVGPPGDAASMSRSFHLEIGEYQRLRVRLRPGKDVKTTIVAEVDGKEQTVAERIADSHDAFEIAGPIRGRMLSRLTLIFTVEPGASILPPENEQGGSVRSHAIQLRWIMLEKDGDAWTPPKEPFKGFVVEGSVGRFEPGVGLLFDGDELQRMRDVVASPVYERTWRGDLDYAARQFQVDPASLIRPYSLYVPSRYGRDSDLRYETIQDGIMLALVGLITRNEDYLRQAARHAVALAHIDHWSEGFVDRMPGYLWYHSGFAPNVATIKASLLLDWTWHYLTPDGRQFVRNAIARKGLPFVERAKHAMANQGVRFNKGIILGRMALADSLDDPKLRQYARECIHRINPKLLAIVRPDGSFSEGFDYGSSTLTSALVTYQAASRCLGVPIEDLATQRMLPAMHHVLLSRGEVNPVLAAFCAGPLGDEAFESQCVPAGLLRSHDRRDHPTPKTWPWWPSAVNRTEYAAYGLHSLWAPGFRTRPDPPRLPRFWASAAKRKRGDVPPLHGGSQTLDASQGPVNVGANQDYLQDVAGATVAAWIKVSKGSLMARENCIYQSTGSPSSRLHLQVRGKGTPQTTGTLAAFMRRVDTDKTASLFSTSTICFDQWVHVALAVDYVGGTYHFYINGSDAGSGPTGLSPGRSQRTPTPENWVGAGSGGKHFPGLIDDVRVYRRTLSTDEVRCLAGPRERRQTGAKTDDLADPNRGLVLHYQFEENGPQESDLASPDGTATPADDGFLMASGGWVFLGDEDPLAPRWNFESGLWDMHGHAWRHKHSMTLRGWGKRLLIERNILPYSDSRSEYTQKTKAYNVFSPAERDQSPGAGRGGKIQVAEDLGPVAVVQSDNATAWSSGVQQAIRRAILFRPAIMVVHDDVLLSGEETGVQNWVSFHPWEVEGKTRCFSGIGDAAVRLHCLASSRVELVTGEDSVSDEREGVVPVYRAAFISPAAKRHSLLTMIEAIGPTADAADTVVRLLDNGCVEVRQGTKVMRVAVRDAAVAEREVFGCRSDARLLFAVREDQRLINAGACDATWFETPDGRIKGKGFLRWPAVGEGQ